MWYGKVYTWRRCHICYLMYVQWHTKYDIPYPIVLHIATLHPPSDMLCYVMSNYTTFWCYISTRLWYGHIASSSGLCSVPALHTVCKCMQPIYLPTYLPIYLGDEIYVYCWYVYIYIYIYIYVVHTVHIASIAYTGITFRMVTCHNIISMLSTLVPSPLTQHFHVSSHPRLCTHGYYAHTHLYAYVAVSK